MLKKNGADNIPLTYDHIGPKARLAMTICNCSKQLGSGGVVSPEQVQGRVLIGVQGSKHLEAPRFGASNGTEIRHKTHSCVQFFLLTKSHKVFINFWILSKSLQFEN